MFCPHLAGVFFDEKKLICAIKNLDDGTIDPLITAMGCPARCKCP